MAKNYTALNKEPTEIVSVKAVREAHILDIIRANPSITLDEVAERIGKSPRTVKTAVKSMQERGILERVGGKKNGRWVIKQKPQIGIRFSF